MYAAINSSATKRYVLNCSRRLGKTYLLCVMALEKAIQHPGSDIKIATMSQKATRKIVTPIMRQILDTCPKHLRPKFRVHDGIWEFTNGSIVHTCGTEMNQIDNLRGQACDLALIDEAGFVSELEYVIDSVLMPQMLTRPGSRMILASTPPVTPDHAFVLKYMEAAIATGAYSKFDIYSNPLLAPEQIEEFKADAGGADSTTWRREYLAEVMMETKNALFPEVAGGDLLDRMIYEVKRPPFFLPITAIDLGYLDYTGVLFGYYHFQLGKIVIEDEILVNKATSVEIVEMVIAKERELWGDIRPQIRVVDGPALVIADMNRTHSFGCRLPEKSDLSANVNRVRMDLADSRYVIHPRCEHLQSQLRFAVWDKSRTKFARSSSAGHYDLAAALLYFARHVDRRTNPTPPGYGWDPYNDWGFPRSGQTSTAAVVSTILPYKHKLI